MKQIVYLFMLMTLTVNTYESSCQTVNSTVAVTFQGIWYLKTRTTTEYRTLSLPHLSPIVKASFEKCNDEIEIKKFPIIVKNLRKKDIFRNSRTIEFDTADQIVDTAYWVAQTNNTTLNISSYGKKFKKYFTITHFSMDSFIVANAHVYVKKFPIKDEGTISLDSALPKSTKKNEMDQNE